MCTAMWILAVATFAVNLPSIFLYALPALRRTSTDGEARAAMLFVISRSAALAIAALIAMAAALLTHDVGWVLGVAVVTALVQAIDVPIAATTGEKATRARTAIGAAVLFAIEFVLILVVLNCPS